MTKSDLNVTRKPFWFVGGWRYSLLRRELIVICLFIFITDTILGSMRPIFSLFATSLGASLTLVGGLSLVVGLTQLSSAMIVGNLSDRRGRKGVLMVGMLLLALSALLMALTTNPYFLLPVQVLLGLGFVSTITVGLAYTTDVASVQERRLAVGLVTTMMGLGYAVGSVVGGTVAELGGFTLTYFLSSAMAMLGFLIAWIGIPLKRNGIAESTIRTMLPIRRQVRALMSNPVVLAVSLGGLLIHLMFGGVMVAFFPIYAHGLGISRAAIGYMFAIRALASTLARLPGGVIAMRIPSLRILLIALLQAMTVAIVLPQFEYAVVLACLLVGEGIAYGVYFAIAQATIAERGGESSRGAALGLYGMVTGAGDSVLPFVLGIIAESFGLISVFYVVGALLMFGAGIMARVAFRRHTASDSPEYVCT